MFIPENKLEAGLKKSEENPAYCPQFYKDLMQSDVFIIKQLYPPGIEDNQRETNTEEFQIVAVKFNGYQCIPFFTSLKRLREAIKTDQKVGYVEIKACEIFSMVPKMDMVLNPGSDFSRKFTHDEISAILDGSIQESQETLTDMVIQGQFLSIPLNYPKEFANRLVTYFKNNKEVNKAYLAHLVDPEKKKKNQTIVGIEMTGNPEDIMAGCNLIANTVNIPDPPVNFIPFKNEKERKKLFERIPPFYKRKRFNFF